MSRQGDFWARRKAAVEAEAEADARAEEQAQIADEHARLDAKSDAEILAELDLPDPDTLKPGDNVQAFMAQAVPDRLRRRALRQLFKLNPVLANVDGLVDYGEDFTDAALVVENMQTAYQVGKGMLKHVEEMARQAEAKAKAAESAADEIEDAPSDEPVALAATEDAAPETPAPDADAPHDAPEPQTQENESDTHFAAVPRRRMRFAYEA